MNYKICKGMMTDGKELSTKVTVRILFLLWCGCLFVCLFVYVLFCDLWELDFGLCSCVTEMCHQPLFVYVFLAWGVLIFPVIFNFFGCLLFVQLYVFLHCIDHNWLFSFAILHISSNPVEEQWEHPLSFPELRLCTVKFTHLSVSLVSVGKSCVITSTV